jgi:hypothetical protein
LASFLPGINPDLASLVLSGLHGNEDEVEAQETDFSNLLEKQILIHAV